VRFVPTTIEGCWVIELPMACDERGAFRRVFDREEFARRRLCTSFVQVNHASSTEAGTLRGLHLQGGRHAEAKLVSCVGGALFDVVVDLRPQSPTYLRWHGIELSPGAGRAVYVPEGTAHGYLTLRPETHIVYQVSCAYRPESESGARWNDPSFAIQWPRPPAVLSDKDRSWPDFRPPTSPHGKDSA
jgi:dTDP-4-dehydrorhamnose 3,5-epimerase